MIHTTLSEFETLEILITLSPSATGLKDGCPHRPYFQLAWFVNLSSGGISVHLVCIAG